MTITLGFEFGFAAASWISSPRGSHSHCHCHEYWQSTAAVIGEIPEEVRRPHCPGPHPRWVQNFPPSSIRGTVQHQHHHENPGSILTSPSRLHHLYHIPEMQLFPLPFGINRAWLKRDLTPHPRCRHTPLASSPGTVQHGYEGNIPGTDDILMRILIFLYRSAFLFGAYYSRSPPYLPFSRFPTPGVYASL